MNQKLYNYMIETNVRKKTIMESFTEEEVKEVLRKVMQDIKDHKIEVTQQRRATLRGWAYAMDVDFARLIDRESQSVSLVEEEKKIGLRCNDCEICFSHPHGHRVLCDVCMRRRNFKGLPVDLPEATWGYRGD